MPYASMTLLKCFVPGTPIGEGSLSSNGRGQLYWSNASKLNPWRKAIQEVAEAFRDRTRPEFDGPVGVIATFYIPRPKSVTREYPTPPTDLDKYIRAVGDALTKAKIISDDSRIIDWHAKKRYADLKHPPGVSLEVYTDEFTD